MRVHLPLFKKDRFFIDGITICNVIFCWIEEPSETFWDHEQTHVEQWKGAPFMFHARYFSELFVNKLKGMSWREAYRGISYEKQARGEA